MALVRYYAPHTPELFETKGMQRIIEHLVSSMLSINANPDVPWELCIHAVRLTAPGEVTPEGIHRNSYHFVLSAVVSRLRVEGGHSLVHPGKKEAPMLDVPMAAGDTLFINDCAVCNTVTNVSGVPRVEEGGHRDVIIITIRPWPTDTAGELVDDVALAQLALLEGTLEEPAPEEDSVAKSFWQLFLERLGHTAST
ncbi:2OG-Fe dioxygenase-domain-containing protein [Pavlovales sp. CCMP2436]|nr:2OG-Fe dioxygenase-domain-containing protein [Pavlovales sp. CCMP2436]